MAETPNNEIRPRRPWLAALLTLWTPGLGQFYCGRWQRALALWVGGPLLLVTLAFVGLPKSFMGFLAWLAIALLYYLGVAWDAARLARGSEDYRLGPFNRWYLYLLLGIVSSFTARPLLAILPVRTFWVPSSAMEPTIRPGDHLVADVTRWRSHLPSRGDIVIFASPEDSKAVVVTRVLAVAGERIEIRNRVVFLNGQPLAHDWGTPRDPGASPGTPSGMAEMLENFGPLAIPPGTFFALGDNRDNSYDSRFYGPVPTTLLRGQPLYLYWARDKSRIGTPLR